MKVYQKSFFKLLPVIVLFPDILFVPFYRYI